MGARPGLVMVIDPRSQQPGCCVAAMLEALGVAGQPQTTTIEGTGWAAGAIAPPAALPECGADAWADYGDILIWAGDIFLPEDWSQPDAKTSPQGAVSRALLQHLRSDGVDILAKLDGAFCGAWYNRRRNRWAIFNDRLGLLPVFWTAAGDRLVVGPSAWLTWQATGEPLAIDEDGVVDVLRTLNITEDRTLIKGVHWLLGGHVLFWSPANSDTRRGRTYQYWEFRHRTTSFRSRADAMDAYVAGLERTLKQQTAGVSSPLLGISGGMDSRMILAACHRMGIVPDCFSAGWPFSEDVRFGRRLARKAGAQHTFVPVDTGALPELLTAMIIETDGLHGAGHMGIGSPVPGYLAEHTGSVLLEGYMLGVLGGAYFPQEGDVPLHCAPHQCRWARTRAHSGGDIEQINHLLQPDLARSSYQRWQSQIDDRYHRAPSTDPLERAEYTIVNGRSGRIDVLGLNPYRRHAALRSPGTAGRLLDWCADTPGSWRRGKQLYMEIIRQRYPRFARVPRANCNGLPITKNRLLREYCWQAEKLYRFRAGRRYPQTRRWGLGGAFKTACVFEPWHNAGNLGLILEPGARVLNWVAGPALKTLWQIVLQDPSQATPLLALKTIETMVRFLERLAPLHEPELGNVSAQMRSETGVVVCATS